MFNKKLKQQINELSDRVWFLENKQRVDTACSYLNLFEIKHVILPDRKFKIEDKIYGLSELEWYINDIKRQLYKQVSNKS